MATVLLTMRGTPFIFQGQELGCSNISWNEIEMYNDIGSRSQFNFAIQEGFSKSKAIEFVKFFSRDNARTPMQWNDKKNAGFSSAEKTWLPVNENYQTVNAEVEEKNSDSVLNWYKKLADFRNKNVELLAGDFNLLLPNDEKIFAFTRSLGEKTFLIAVNFSTDKVDLPKNFVEQKILIDSEKDFDKNFLQPLETRIYQDFKVATA